MSSKLKNVTEAALRSQRITITTIRKVVGEVVAAGGDQQSILDLLDIIVEGMLKEEHKARVMGRALEKQETT